MVHHSISHLMLLCVHPFLMFSLDAKQSKFENHTLVTLHFKQATWGLGISTNVFLMIIKMKLSNNIEHLL